MYVNNLPGQTAPFVQVFQEEIVPQLKNFMLVYLQILVSSVFPVLLAPVLLLWEIHPFYVICHVNLRSINALPISVVV